VTHFDDLFWLVAVVDAGTLSAAAERHGVSGAAVSKRLRLLEQRLSVRLLERNARRLRTTEAGEMYYRRGKRLLEAFAELEENVSSTNELLRGTIRINSPHSFALLRLADPVATFMREHPEVNVQIHLDDSYIDINDSDYDIVIRIGKLEDSSVVSRRVASTSILCCASPEYLATYGEPLKPEELSDRDCLIYNQFYSWGFSKSGERQEVAMNGSVQSDNGQFLSLLAERGHGVILQPYFIVQSALERGSLTRILSDYHIDEVGVYALYPSRQYLPQKIKRFVSHLKNVLSDQPA